MKRYVKLATWIYDGPVYRFDRVFSDKEHFETSASSAAKAAQNIRFQAANAFGLNPGCVKIDKKAVREDLISDPNGFSSGSIRAPRSYWNSEEYRQVQQA